MWRADLLRHLRHTPHRSGLDNCITYTGRERDSPLHLHHFRARILDPQLGRFCGRDPIGYVESWSLYFNPLIFTQTDAFGLNATEARKPAVPDARSECRCCSYAVQDLRNGGIITRTIDGRLGECPLSIACRPGCPAPGFTKSIPVRGTQTPSIEIGIDCRYANQALEGLILHELVHAQDFGDGSRIIDLPSCRELEGRGCDATCKTIFWIRGLFGLR
ncbi:MAG: hypothetical protein D6753_11625 [Planctomycetota bacterium]|nr:MAG: hypothetical protein D6753_11625 [Planctomycetota bacterium]